MGCHRFRGKKEIRVKKLLALLTLLFAVIPAKAQTTPAQPPNAPQAPPQAQTPKEPLTPTVDDTVAWINKNLKDAAVSIKGSDLVFHQDGDPSPDPRRGVTAPNGLAGLNIDTRMPISSIDVNGIADGSWRATMRCQKNAGDCIASTWKDDNSAGCPEGDHGQKQNPVPACSDSYHDADGNPTAPDEACDVYGRCAKRLKEVEIATSPEYTARVATALRHLVRLLQQKSQSDLF
jgi:hypothetical protein